MELYWKILGKRYRECGLDDFLMEAGVLGPNSASLVMQDKRCTLAHKLMFEVVGRLKWQAFLIWMVRRKENISSGSSVQK